MPHAGRFLADTLDEFREFLPDELLPEQTWPSLRRSLADFPDDCTEILGFEFDLRRRDTPADLSICARRPEDVHAIFRHLGERRLADPIWGGLKRFCDDWRDEPEFFSTRVKSVWLQFDAHAAGDLQFKPGYYIQIQPLAGGVAAADWIDRIGWIIDRSLDRLSPAVATPLSAPRLAGVLEPLPADAALTYFGSMGQRGLAAVRFIATFNRPEAIPGYLAAIGWRGPRDLVEQLVGYMAPVVDMINLIVDYGDGILPRIGLECSARHQYLHDWGGVFERLVRDGHCLESKAAAIVRGLGTSLAPGDDHFVLLDRYFSHVKFALSASTPLETKGYLACQRVLKPNPFATLEG